jgi:TonB-dependent SusC/RagA subfamily outer membrane receptor
MKKVLIIGLFFFALMHSKVHAQELEVKGKVTAYNKIPINKADISIKGSDAKIMTDSLGLFSLKCNRKAKIVVEANGFYKQTLDLKDLKDSLRVNLVFKGGKKNIQIATGYGHIDEDKLTHAMSHLKSENIKYTSYSNILEMIQGRVTGVSIVNDKIYIRGKNTMSGDDVALTVVDGVVVNWYQFINIDPSTVESINVLKGSGAAMYGSRAMNGVVVVTTKKK